MADGTRPNVRIPHTLHGAMRDISDERDRSVEEMYVVATKFFVALSDEVDYDPNSDPLLDEMWQNCYDAAPETDT